MQYITNYKIMKLPTTEQLAVDPKLALLVINLLRSRVTET